MISMDLTPPSMERGFKNQTVAADEYMQVLIRIPSEHFSMQSSARGWGYNNKVSRHYILRTLS